MIHSVFLNVIAFVKEQAWNKKTTRYMKYKHVKKKKESKKIGDGMRSYNQHKLCISFPSLKIQG